jgi:hypothetical protein
MRRIVRPMPDMRYQMEKSGISEKADNDKTNNLKYSQSLSERLQNKVGYLMVYPIFETQPLSPDSPIT